VVEDTEVAGGKMMEKGTAEQRNNITKKKNR
jgi:hypothetical protein